MPPLLKIGQALTMALLLSCGRDEPVPANAIKTIVVPPRDTAAMRAHRNDSSFVVLRAAAALHNVEAHSAYQLLSYQRTDSGTLVTLLAMCGNPPKSCIGGGQVFVDSLGAANVIDFVDSLGGPKKILHLQ